MNKAARNCVRVRSVRRIVKVRRHGGDEVGQGKKKKVDPTALNDNGVNIFAGPYDLPYRPLYWPSHAAID